MSIFEVLWKLPVAVALQIYYYQIQRDHKLILVTGENDDQLLARLRQCRI